ncbi:MAG: cytochrome c [Planctomycetes bacterium]|nr:cytochrome c [Planctomycetota bacterium]
MTRLLSIVLPLLFLAQAGCGSQPYPAGLAYPARTDPIVFQLPLNPPDGPPPAGKLDEFIAGLNDRGGRVLNPADLPAEQKAKLQEILGELFGTPAAPMVATGDDDGREHVERLRLLPDTLTAGSLLYKKFCLQCHGLTGDGRGPTGQWVYPAPRDLRQGIYKYVSSVGSAARKPTRADLHRVLIVGIDRTSMPPFTLLSDAEREQLVSFTIYLGLRGEVEYRILYGLLSQSDEMDDDLAVEARSLLRSALRQWVRADEERITPKMMPTPEDPNQRITEAHLESVRRGQRIFANTAVGCIACHTDYGRQARYLYDSWGSSVRVSDLTEGAYRGGKTPLDLFQRIHGGIGASGMPAATSLTEEQTWDLVHFILALPVPSMLPADVRGLVYPGK